MTTMNGAVLAEKAAVFTDTSPLNRVEELGGLRIFDQPLVGVASAHDPLFAKLKMPEVIAPHHWSPTEWLPEAKSVLVYFLPFSEAVRRANRTPGMPATEWLYGRIEGEAFSQALRRYLLAEIEGMGYKALAPSLDSRFAIVDRRSNWSERHAAFIAGLGTFGLGKSLITERGCAGRCGSLVTDLVLEPTQRRYTEIYEHCNHCGACIPRCPAGAIRPEGKDVAICARYLDQEIKPRFKPRYGCGKCQTAIPCEAAIPRAR